MLQPNTTYTLLVDVGRRLEAGLTADYSLTLQAGSTVLATIRASNITASAGYFQTQSLFYTPPASPPAGNITIVLTSYGPQVNFKNVRLNLSSPSTVHYYFSDHLGSTDLVTDALGTMSACPANPSLITGEEESDYYPFGGERVLCDRGIGNNYKFTGKEATAKPVSTNSAPAITRPSTDASPSPTGPPPPPPSPTPSSATRNR